MAAPRALTMSMMVVALSALAVQASAQAPSLARDTAQQEPLHSTDARKAASDQGNAAMERLRSAMIGQKERSPVSGPSVLPEPSDALRRRAFDALRARAPAPAIDARARAALKAGEEKMAAERATQAKRIAQALGLEAPDMVALAKTMVPAGSKSWVPLLFVSSSMPIATLRTYAGQLERVGGVFAFRGMPGDLARVAPMAKLAAEILRRDPGCEGPACAMRNVQLIVDPLVFRQHGVTVVPALAMVPGDPTQPYCERDDESPRASHIIYGDAALSGLLDEYARLGGKEEGGMKAAIAADLSKLGEPR